MATYKKLTETDEYKALVATDESLQANIDTEAAARKEAMTALQALLRTVDIGHFTTTALAWEAAAQQALNFRTVSRIYYEVADSSDGDLDASQYGTNACMEQHYYKDLGSSVFNVIQSLFTEGKTGKCYRRVIALSLDGTSISSIGAWETIVS